MRLIATSDLHHTYRSSAKIADMAQQIKSRHPDIFLVLGDVGEGDEQFDNCLSHFDTLTASKHVIPGNHDLYEYADARSEHLLRTLLPMMAKKRNFQYGGVKEFGDYTLLMCPCWCSGLFNSNAWSQNAIEKSYISYMSDGHYISMSLKRLHQEQLQWFTEALKQVKTSKLIVGSHYPIFEELYVPFNVMRPSDAYFYSPEFGEVLKSSLDRFDRVIAIAGHVHRHCRKEVQGVECYIIGSDYNRPEYIEIEL